MESLKKKIIRFINRIGKYTNILKSKDRQPDFELQKEKEEREAFIREKAMISKSREQWPGGPIG